MIGRGVNNKTFPANQRPDEVCCCIVVVMYGYGFLSPEIKFRIMAQSLLIYINGHKTR